MTPFALDPRLAADSLPVTDLMLSTVRLMNDATFPWLLLVPRRAGASEIVDLADEDRHHLIDEIALASRAVRIATGCDKLNVAALGNQVAQLHVHVIARFRTDPAWPGPVWGKVPAAPYTPDAARARISALRTRFGELSDTTTRTSA